MSAKPGPPPAPAPAPQAPAPVKRSRTVGSYLLFGASACLGLLAAFHATNYFTAALAVRNSGLTPYFQEAFRALWLGFSLQTALIAAIVLIAGFRPGSVSRPVVVLCGLLPLVSGALILVALQSTFGLVLLCLATLLVLGGALLQPRAQPPRAEL